MNTKNECKDINHIHTSIDAEKDFDKNPTCSYDKIPRENGIIGKTHHHNKDYI